ncbi:MAG: hypothetical protein WCD42_05165 [Rhizomicrobium sp.]
MSLCRHFGVCGGCAFQDKSQTEYRALKLETVTAALAGSGVSADVEDLVIVPPQSRRRATVKALRTPTGTKIGFHAARSHDIVDMTECRVLTPALVEFIGGLRAMLDELLHNGESAELKLTQLDGGMDVSLHWVRKNDTETLALLARWAQKLKIARLSRDGVAQISLVPPTVRLGLAAVTLPPEAFLQPTLPGEQALQKFVLTALVKTKKVADLFAGCGTFSLPLAQKVPVHAVELEGDHLAALAAAARQPGFKPVTVEKRNLFKQPVTERELKAYDGVCLDPPRGGAEAQARVLATSSVRYLAYVSCDAASFARDAAILIAGGYRLTGLIAVDQFLWSNHIELAASFRKSVKRFP